MATEIELKYLVENEQVCEKITQLLNVHHISFIYDQVQLTNCYFDTKQLALRQHDFGLRVRSKNGKREQTIKAAGQVIGGLHKRPEYNVDIEQNFPELALFPEEIWPENINLDTWQEELTVLFSTDFQRSIWTIEFQQSQIELAFDLGVISSAGNSLDICEIELELLTGVESDIFDLARMLMAVLLLRPGTLSKAARGYTLFHQIDNTLTVPEEVEYPYIPLTGGLTCQQAFIDGLTFTLSHLQRMVERYFENPCLVQLGRVNHALLLMRHGFWLFDDYLHHSHAELRKELSHFLTMLAWQNNANNLHDIVNKSGGYRKKIEYNDALVKQLKLAERRFPTVHNVKELLQSSRFNQLQLSLLALILEGSEALKVSENQPSIYVFTSSALEQSLIELDDEIAPEQQLTTEQYLADKRILNRSLLTGSWCAELYDEAARNAYRAPWLDLLQGITELETLSMLRSQLEQLQNLEQSSDKLMQWLDSKIENLLVALDATRKSALAAVPYWR